MSLHSFRLILGGGVIKHHVCNANLMRNGADFSVFINTGQVRRDILGEFLQFSSE